MNFSQDNKKTMPKTEPEQDVWYDHSTVFQPGFLAQAQAQNNNDQAQSFMVSDYKKAPNWGNKRPIKAICDIFPPEMRLPAAPMRLRYLFASFFPIELHPYLRLREAIWNLHDFGFLLAVQFDRYAQEMYGKVTPLNSHEQVMAIFKDDFEQVVMAAWNLICCIVTDDDDLIRLDEKADDVLEELAAVARLMVYRQFRWHISRFNAHWSEVFSEMAIRYDRGRPEVFGYLEKDLVAPRVSTFEKETQLMSSEQ